LEIVNHAILRNLPFAIQGNQDKRCVCIKEIQKKRKENYKSEIPVMENTLPDENSGLASFLNMKKLKDPGEPLQEKVILPDECGDSLWEEILTQDKKKVTIESDSENKIFPDSIDNVPVDEATEAKQIS
jgi:hypothetical protein